MKLTNEQKKEISDQQSQSYSTKRVTSAELEKILKVNRVRDQIWYISNMGKFKKHYPNWKQKYTTKKILKELIISTQF